MLTDFLCLAALAAANGANDVSRAAATLVGGRVTTYKRALTWVVAWTFGGSLLSGIIALGVARRFAAALGTHQDQLVIAVPAILLGSTVWIGISTYRRLPVATTHALVGSLLGVMWFVGGWAACKRIDLAKGFVIPLLASPVLAVMCSGLLRKLMPGFLDFKTVHTESCTLGFSRYDRLQARSERLGEDMGDASSFGSNRGTRGDGIYSLGGGHRCRRDDDWLVGCWRPGYEEPGVSGDPDVMHRQRDGKRGDGFDYHRGFVDELSCGKLACCLGGNSWCRVGFQSACFAMGNNRRDCYRLVTHAASCRGALGDAVSRHY